MVMDAQKLAHAIAQSLKQRDTGQMYLTAKQVTERWKGAITTGTLANWRTRKEGPPYVKLGGRVLYPVQQLEAWEQRQLHAANDNAGLATRAA